MGANWTQTLGVLLVLMMLSKALLGLAVENMHRVMSDSNGANTSGTIARVTESRPLPPVGRFTPDSGN